MRVIRVERFDDPRLADYRNVSDGQLLRRRNCFVAEGRAVVGRLLDAGGRVESLLVNDASYRALENAISRLLPPDIPVYVSDAEQFTMITGFNLHRGCLALAERPVERTFEEVIRQARLLLVLEGVTDADNVGSAFRNAAAFGASVALTETCCDPLYRKAIRTSMGSVLLTPYARIRDWRRDLATLKREGFALVALTPREDAINLATYPRGTPGERIALLIGSEGPGLTEAAYVAADACVRIPIRAEVDSLNLATAAGIALHHFADPS
jgi:tRNA G18 (ribose-2'-O)-methylase SpoU